MKLTEIPYDIYKVAEGRKDFLVKLELDSVSEQSGTEVSGSFAGQSPLQLREQPDHGRMVTRFTGTGNTNLLPKNSLPFV